MIWFTVPSYVMVKATCRIGFACENFMIRSADTNLILGLNF